MAGSDDIKIGADVTDVDQKTRVLDRKRQSQAKRQKAVAQRRRQMARKWASRALTLGAGARGLSRFAGTDMFAEASVSYLASIQDSVDDYLGSARASKAGRDDAKQALASVVGARGYLSVAGRDLSRRMIDLRRSEEKGRNLLRQDPGVTGPSLGEVAEAAARGYAALIAKSFDYARQALRE